MGGTLPLGELARKTPADRNRAIDLVRAIAILAVVLGHWLMAVLYLDADGDVRRRSLLGMADWTHPYTWAFQVIPLVFVVGGYANAISWRHHREAGGTYADWLHHRLHRLTFPVVPLLAAWLVAVPLLQELGTDNRVLRIADRAALVPTWFIAAYVLIIVLAPPTLVLWERIGWWSVAGGLALALLIDALAIGGGIEGLGYLNPVVVWVTVHQLGYAWRDGAIGGTAARLALGLGGLLALVLLVRLGPYGVSMVGVRTHDVSNTYPTRATLAFLGVAQAGIAMALEPWLNRLATRARVWTATVAVNAHIMTLYLWHLTMVGVVAVASSALGGVGLGPDPNTAEWWWTRPVWVVFLVALTLPVVLLLGRFEHGRMPRSGTSTVWYPLSTAAVTLVGLGLIASWGIAAPDGTFHWYLPLGFLLLLGFLDHARRSAHPDPARDELTPPRDAPYGGDPGRA